MTSITWAEVQDFLGVVRHVVLDSADRTMLRVFVVDVAGAPQYPVAVKRNADLRGNSCKKFLRDIQLEHGEFRSLITGKMSYHEYIALLQGGRLP